LESPPPWGKGNDLLFCETENRYIPESGKIGGVVRVLFVCLGNICRSPMAESILRHKLMGHTDVFVDSAGTGNWHVGENPDPRTIDVLRRRGIHDFSRARQLRSADFEEFDHIIGMDAANIRDILAWPGARPEKVSLASSWLDPNSTDPVPDPYYGSPANFESVFHQLDQISDAILVRIARDVLYLKI
jgi:protein-tyrosine phosphatase